MERYVSPGSLQKADVASVEEKRLKAQSPIRKEQK